ncbi:MAG: hypothetical protein HY302_00070 [Opitutae bacterium]|nr:hypothetical protein [Opitutae bacterium]
MVFDAAGRRVSLLAGPAIMKNVEAEKSSKSRAESVALGLTLGAVLGSRGHPMVAFAVGLAVVLVVVERSALTRSEKKQIYGQCTGLVLGTVVASFVVDNWAEIKTGFAEGYARTR